MLRLVISLCILITLSSLTFAEEIYPFTDKKQEVQFHYLLKELRCPVCQNQDLSDSNAGVAKDLRNEVYRMVITGNSDEDIIKHLTSRFGDFILFKPKLKAATYLLWYGPVIFILLGALVFFKSTKRKRYA